MCLIRLPLLFLLLLLLLLSASAEQNNGAPQAQLAQRVIKNSTIDTPDSTRS